MKLSIFLPNFDIYQNQLGWPVWSNAKKIFFRWVFLYCVLYCVLQPINPVEIFNSVFSWLYEFLHKLIPWIGKYLLQLPYDITIFTNGSGDTTYNYVLLLFSVFLSLAGCLIWTLLDRKRQNYEFAHYCLRVVIRFYLFSNLLLYGLSKVIRLQFPELQLSQLILPLGESTPMGLAWKYMQYSPAYNMITGLAEITAGILLLWRRTTTLGALLTAVVMGNVVAMNFCFDIPVKLFSLHLFLMSLFLLAGDWRRLLNLLILNRTIPIKVWKTPELNKKYRTGLIVVKYSCILSMLYVSLFTVVAADKKYGRNAPKPALYGLYQVEQFIRNKDTIAPLTTDSFRWDKMVIESDENVNIKSMTINESWFQIKTDTIKREFHLSTPREPGIKYSFAYINQPGGGLAISGKLFNDSLKVKLKRIERNNFELISRGFHWINEYPYNK